MNRDIWSPYTRVRAKTFTIFFSNSSWTIKVHVINPSNSEIDPTIEFRDLIGETG